eukprot:12890792-Prorocentrum_lima.AAC.1
MPLAKHVTPEAEQDKSRACLGRVEMTNANSDVLCFSTMLVNLDCLPRDVLESKDSLKAVLSIMNTQ